MTTCRCESCSAASGLPPLPTHTQAWRLECEARALLRWPLAARRKYLARPAVQARRRDLESELLRLFKRRNPDHAQPR